MTLEDIETILIKAEEERTAEAYKHLYELELQRIEDEMWEQEMLAADEGEW